MSKIYVDEVQKSTQRQKEKISNIGLGVSSLIRSENVNVADIEKNLQDMLVSIDEDENERRIIKENTTERMNKYLNR